MITFIYPKEDWTAAEMAMKVRGLAGSRNLRVYTTPKHGKRDNEQVYNKLKDTKYAIFLAYDQTEIDLETREELNFLKKHGIPVYFVIPDTMEENVTVLGFEKDVYTYKLGNRENLTQILKTILMELTSRDDKKEDFWVLIVLVGLILFVLFLFSETESDE